MKKFLITILILAFLVGGGALGAYIYRSNKRNSNPVNVYSVSNWLGNYYDMETSLSGNIVLSDEQTVYIERDKIIKEIHATPGDAVKVGDVLLEYDTTQEQLKLNTMIAELAVTETNVKLANNQLAKLQGITPIPDDSEIPETEAEKRVREADEALQKAQDEAIQPAIDEADAEATALERAENLKDIEADFYELRTERYKAKKVWYDFLGKEMDEEDPDKDKTEEPTEENTEATTEVSTEELTENDRIREETRLKTLFVKADEDYKKASEDYNNATTAFEDAQNKYLEAQKKSEEAQKAVDEAQKKYDEAFEAQQKEYEEQMENPTPVYTESELKRAIRLKNEEIKDLNLSIANQNLAIKRQQNIIDKGKVVSELDGTIQICDISEEAISGGQPAIVVSAEGAYSAKVSVDEFSLDEIQIGDEVTILSYDTGNTYFGKVSKKSEAPTNDSYNYYEYTASSYPVTVVIEGGEDLAEGMWVEVTPSSDFAWDAKANEIVLPLALCKKENGGYYVMKRDGDRLKKQYISTGKIYWGQYIVVKSGLNSGDFIAFPYEKDAVEGKVCKEADLSDLYGY